MICDFRHRGGSAEFARTAGLLPFQPQSHWKTYRSPSLSSKQGTATMCTYCREFYYLRFAGRNSIRHLNEEMVTFEPFKGDQAFTVDSWLIKGALTIPQVALLCQKRG